MSITRSGALAIIAFAAQAQASYVLTPLSGGQSSISVNPGDSFTLDLNLESSDGLDQHNSAIFQLIFTSPGLELLSYSWAVPYETGSIFDDSTPGFGDLPLVVDANTLSGPNHPDGVIDIEFSNVLLAEAFQDGVLLSLEIHMPEDWDSSPISIFAIPDTFADGFNEIDAVSGQGFTIVPAPGTIAILGISLATVRRRRRR